MPRPRRIGSRAPALPVLTDDTGTGAPLWARVYRQVREHILGGALRPGTRLPSARTLAADLGVSRNTVEAAFSQLRAEGFVARRVGAGSFVARELPDLLRDAGVAAGRRRVGPAQSLVDAAASLGRLSPRGAKVVASGQVELEADRQPGPCSPDVTGFPLRTWNRLQARAARRAGAAALLPPEAGGLRPLREAIAAHLRLARGVLCLAEQVIIVGSTQQAVDLVARLLLAPGDTALVEDPGYPSARGALEAAGARVRGVPVDGEGVRTDRLPRSHGTRLLYLTPSHQFPLGMTLGLARRLDVIRWAADTGAWVLEDDYDSEYRHDGRPIAAMQGLDPHGRVLYVGSFNKVLFPAARVAYLVVPVALADAFAAGRRLLDGFTPPLLQQTLADFLGEGHYAAHVRQARQRYAAGRDLLVRSITETWGNAVRLGPSEAGLHLVAHLPAGTDDVRIAGAASGAGLGIAPLSSYYLGAGARAGLLLGYGAARPAAIPATIRTLAPHVTRFGGR